MELEPLFLSEEHAIEIHAEQIRAFGGSEGLLYPDLLASAIAQPQQISYYNPQATLFDLAAAYTFYLGKNHPFSDGNKRTAIACAIAFLEVNGWLVEQELTDEVLALVVGEIDREQFANALEKVSVRKRNPWRSVVEFFRKTKKS